MDDVLNDDDLNVSYVVGGTESGKNFLFSCSVSVVSSCEIFSSFLLFLRVTMSFFNFVTSASYLVQLSMNRRQQCAYFSQRD